MPHSHAAGDKPKTHLEGYLNFYLKQEEPGYAVLVTGAWGTGKTFQVRNCIAEDNCYYVSLFGIQTVEQLHAEVLATAFPRTAKAGKMLESAGGIAKDVGGIAALGSAAPALFGALFRRDLDPDRTLIFDDLERSRLKPKDLLGAINFYVEQRGFRVIVIAHDEKLSSKFLAMKEKTFGQTIRVAPQTEDAFNTFLARLPNESARKFVTVHQSTILGTFAQSQYESLRVLKHLIEDLGRLFNCLSEQHLAHREAMQQLISLFSAFDIEIRAGNISANDLKHRREQTYGAALVAHARSGGKDVEDPPILVANKKYPSFNLEDGLLSDEVLISIFVDGQYSESNIRASLDNSAYFIKPEEAPPWKVVINFDELEDSVVDDALQRMDAQFDNHEIVDSCEMLHVFALRLMMVDEGIRGNSLDEETDACIRYIDEVLELGLLPPRETNWNWTQGFERGGDGYGYWITDASKPYFERLWNHLMASRRKAFENQLPKIAQKLLKTMNSDPKAFFEMVSPTNNGENPYAHVPVLHSIDPKEFVETWLALPHESWRLIEYALQGRYEHARLERELKAENKWAGEVHRLLLGKADSASGFNSLRIRRIVPKALEEKTSQ